MREKLKQLKDIIQDMASKVYKNKDVDINTILNNSDNTDWNQLNAYSIFSILRCAKGKENLQNNDEFKAYMRERKVKTLKNITKGIIVLSGVLLTAYTIKKNPGVILGLKKSFSDSIKKTKEFIKNPNQTIKNGIAMLENGHSKLKQSMKAVYEYCKNIYQNIKSTLNTPMTVAPVSNPPVAVPAPASKPRPKPRPIHHVRPRPRPGRF